MHTLLCRASNAQVKTDCKPLLGSSRAPHMEAERPKERRWNGVDDPKSHCLAGNSLLLTGTGDVPGPDPLSLEGVSQMVYRRFEV